MKRLFVYCYAMITALVVHAQWVKPSHPKTIPFSADGQECVLYNVEADAFLTGANEWGTRASLAPSEGYRVRISPTDENTYLIETFVEHDGWDGAQKWYPLFAEEYRSIFVDYDHNRHDSRLKDTWTIKKLSGNNFEIEHGYWKEAYGYGKLGVSEMVNGKTGNNRLFLHNPAATWEGTDGVRPLFEGKFMSTWALMSLSDYQTYSDAKTIYQEALKLKALMDEARGKYPDLDMTKVEAVYNNTSSTAEELKDANLLLQLLIRQTEDPTNVSNLLKNPTFSEGFKYWTTSRGESPEGNYGGLVAYPTVEIYEKKVDVQQTVTGVPDGVYVVSVQAFERPALNGSYSGTEPAKVHLFMNDYRTPVQHIMNDATPMENAVDQQNCYLSTTSEGVFGVTANPNSYDYLATNGYVPNSMTGASVAFRAGRYVQKTYGLVEDGVMRIGLSSDDELVHWVLWANFNLNYRGKDIDAIEEVFKSLNTRVKDFMASNTVTKLFGDEISKLRGATATAVAAEMQDEAWEALLAYNKAYNNLEANGVALAGLKAMKAAMDEKFAMQQNVLPANKQRYEELSERYKAFDTMTTEQLNALQLEMANLVSILNVPNYNDATEASPVDFTTVVYNNEYQEGNLNGWDVQCQRVDHRMYQSAEYTNNETTISGFAECWRSGQALGDGFIQQTLSHLPAGKYILHADVIAKNQYAGENVMNVELFVSEDEQDTRQSVHTANELPEHYTLQFSKQAKESDLKIGVRWTETNANWVAVDNWRLIYLGSDIATQLAQLIKEVTDFLNNNMPDDNGFARTFVEMAIEDARQASGNIAMEQAYDQLMLTYEEAKQYVANGGNKVLTSVESLRAFGIVTARCYSLSGQQLAAPQRGTNILVLKRADGTTMTRKVFVR